MLVDVVDDWASQCGKEGIDIFEAVRRGLRAALWLGQRISEEELQRLGMLLRSDLLDPYALEVVGNAATALAECQQAASEADKPQRLGLFAGLRALGEPRTQQSLAFAIQFSRAFGDLVGKPCNGSDESEN